MHRREFVRQGAIALTGAALLEAGARSSTGPEARQSTQKGGNYIDAHVHVWTHDPRYPFVKGFDPSSLNPATFSARDILSCARPSGVNRVTLIQLSYYGFDNSYMLAAIRRQPTVFRGVAIVNWKGKEDPTIKMKELTHHGVRGFRIYPKDEPAATCLDGPGLDKMFRCGAEEKLPMCLLIDPDQLPAAERRCEHFPETPVVIDHLGRVGQSGRIEEKDVRVLCSLARFPKVKVKVSAFYALGAKKPPHLDLAPLIRRVYDAFGPKRLMWASDSPLQLQHETYEDSISLVRDRLHFLSSEDKEWMLRRTAEETFFS